MRRLLLAVFVSGCGAELGGTADPASGSGGKGDDPNGSTLRAKAFLEQLGQVQCDHEFACKADFPTDAGITFEDAVGLTPDDCYNAANDFYQADDVDDSVDDGRIVYTEVAAAQCLAGVTFPATCPEFWQVGAVFPDSCGASLVGSVPDGGDCKIDFDCANLTSICAATQKCVASN